MSARQRSASSAVSRCRPARGLLARRGGGQLAGLRLAPGQLGVGADELELTLARRRAHGGHQRGVEVVDAGERALGERRARDPRRALEDRAVARDERLLGVEPDEVLGAHRDARQRAAGGGAQRRGDGGRRGDVGRLADALQPVRRLGVGVLEHLDAHRRHVEDRRQQVVGEGRVEDLAVPDLDLLEQRQPQPLRAAALDLALERLGVHGLAHLLDGGQLDHAHEPQLGVDVDHRAVGREGVLHVRVALAVLVEAVRRAVAPLDGLLDRLALLEHGGRIRGHARARPPAPRSRSRTASHAALTAPPVT